jgi:fused signal recognition particle receptor
VTIAIFIVIVLVGVALVAVPLTYNRMRRRHPDPEVELPPATRRAPSTRPPSTRPPSTRPPSRPPAAGPPPSPVPTAPSAPASPDEAQAEAALEEAAGVEAASLEVAGPEASAEALPELHVPVKPRFRDRLGKARALFTTFLSRTTIDQQAWDDLEEALIRADVGVTLTTTLLDGLRGRVKAEGLTTSDQLVDALKEGLKTSLESADRALRFDPGEVNVWLFVGVNGVGKTTTIGKIGFREAAAGRKVVMAAGDTFRAAAAEQLELWSKRVGADLVRGAEGGDPGAVIFDAVQRAASRGAELVLGDTAGRLHTKVNLMEELKKVRRVAERPPGHLTEVLLVIDATTGQNGLTQARMFAEAVDVTGIVLTKLDGTAKGGIALAIQTELGIPIKLVGLGETPDDLTEFDPDEFVEALLAA